MPTIHVDLNQSYGPIKPMHAGNNGPLGKSARGTSNFDLYQELGIPYARNHDASFCGSYGGEHTVDVHRIFKNFDADENDPNSYLFGPTDKYVKTTFESGTKMFYRLGAAIEHRHKVGTYPPKDFAKWARICEHIIRHYTEGWADGFTYDIEYWEIWNEPDCRNADGSSPTWQGTDEQFIEFYATVATHLKEAFPHLKIGGPAFYSAKRTETRVRFLQTVKERNLPLDFYSYHYYCKTPAQMADAAQMGKDLLQEADLWPKEMIIDEWNYVQGWASKDWMDSIDAWKGLKGSSFIAGTMCTCQYTDLSMLMFYEARPCSMCALFETDRPWVPLKGYYAIKAFNELYQLGTAVPFQCDCPEIYGAAAYGKEGAAILCTYFDNDLEQGEKEITLDLQGNLAGKTAHLFLLSEKQDLAPIGTFPADQPISFKLGLYQTCLIKIQ